MDLRLARTPPPNNSLEPFQGATRPTRLRASEWPTVLPARLAQSEGTVARVGGRSKILSVPPSAPRSPAPHQAQRRCRRTESPGPPPSGMLREGETAETGAPRRAAICFRITRTGLPGRAPGRCAARTGWSSRAPPRGCFLPGRFAVANLEAVGRLLPRRVAHAPGLS